MNAPITDLSILLGSMEPVLHPGTYAFASVSNEETLASVRVVASIREPEGMSAVIAECDAVALNLPILLCAAWITLAVNSDLQAVGLTAAVATALTQAGISCNVIAGAWHDHLFVPVERAAEAMSVLKKLSAARATSTERMP
jgi:hypothetical protein